MKTATIEIFHIFGTKGTTGCQVKYRGKTLFSKMENLPTNTMLNIARDWSLASGFTHIKVNYS